MTGKLDGKVALVSGSGRGIGRQIALKLASEGARVVVNDLDEGPGNETVAELRAMGAEAIACNGDVTQEGFAERFVAADDDKAKQQVISLVDSMGFTPLDVGPLSSARFLEGMAFINIGLNAQNGWSWTSAWKLER